jgi:hypothetical protein
MGRCFRGSVDKLERALDQGQAYHRALDPRDGRIIKKINPRRPGRKARRAETKTALQRVGTALRELFSLAIRLAIRARAMQS